MHDVDPGRDDASSLPSRGAEASRSPTSQTGRDERWRRADPVEMGCVQRSSGLLDPRVPDAAGFAGRGDAGEADVHVYQRVSRRGGFACTYRSGTVRIHAVVVRRLSSRTTQRRPVAADPRNGGCAGVGVPGDRGLAAVSWTPHPPRPTAAGSGIGRYHYVVSLRRPRVWRQPRLGGWFSSGLFRCLDICDYRDVCGRDSTGSTLGRRGDGIAVEPGTVIATAVRLNNAAAQIERARRVSEGCPRGDLNPHTATWSERRNTFYLRNGITVVQSSYLQIRQVCVQSVSKMASVCGRNIPVRRREVKSMKHALLTAAAAALALGCLVASPAAHADGRCLFQGDWNCSGSP
jgi:hypothetical protein